MSQRHPGHLLTHFHPVLHPRVQVGARNPELSEAPISEAPISEAPISEAPISEAPTSEAPTSEAPTNISEAPISEAPTNTSEAGISFCRRQKMNLSLKIERYSNCKMY